MLSGIISFSDRDSQYFILTRDDLEELLLRFPEMHLPLASNGIAACLRVPSMAPAVAGIERKVSERLGRRMAYAKEEFEEGQSMIQAGEQAKVAYVIRTGKVVSEIAEAVWNYFLSSGSWDLLSFLLSAITWKQSKQPGWYWHIS